MLEQSLPSPNRHSSPQAPSRFVSVQGGRFFVDGAPHRFVGANLWCAAYLGADASFGDRDRLRRELDRLKAVGVVNLRILASSELSPLRSAVQPAFRDKHGEPNRDLLEGLDFVLSEMKTRGQRAVLYLTNFWEWSGGMMTHLYWTNGGQIIDMDDPEHPWPEFPDFAAQFYASQEAVALYQDYVRRLVARENSLTGQRYAEDPTIFAWQLANEPRPGVSAAIAARHIDSYVAWIQNTARLLKSLDPNHLVSTGSEGLVGSAHREDYFVRAHETPHIDYLTAHIWPQNWDWISPSELASTFPNAERLTKNYLAQHNALAESLGRPLVVEEFGFPRDDGRFDRSATTGFRDRFYELIHEAVLDSARSNGPLSGSNFWAFGGEGKAAHADYRLRPGESNYLGDPPHEPQGWYSVFDSDTSTLELISAHSAKLRDTLLTR